MILQQGYGRQGKPTAISKKFSGNTLKDAEGKDIVLSVQTQRSYRRS